MGIRKDKCEDGYIPYKNAEVQIPEIVDSSVLVQLCSLKKEKADLCKRISDLRKELEENNCDEKQTYRKVYLSQLIQTEEKIDIETCLAEQFIESLDNSRTRRILRYKCLDDSLSWIQIAHKMGENFTAESCRQIYERAIGIRK